MHFAPDRRRRRLLTLPLLGLPALAGASPALLTVSGAALGPPAQSGRFSFDLPALQQLAQRQLVTSTPWYNEPSTFAGPLLRDALKAAGLPAGASTATTLRCSALNDYRVELPLDDAQRWDVVVALLLNGKPMSVREKGPLFVIYPFDERPELRTSLYFSRCVWQLKHIELA